MADDPKDRHALGLEHETEERGESRELYLSEGRTLRVSKEGTEDLVEIRSSSGLVEVRIKLTEKGRREFRRMAQDHGDWIADLFRGISKSESEALMKSLAILKQSVIAGIDGRNHG